MRTRSGSSAAPGSSKRKRVLLRAVEGDPCCVCLDAMTADMDVRVFPCGHAVHDACFEDLKTKTPFVWKPALKRGCPHASMLCVATDVLCPLCRQKIMLMGSESEPEATVHLLLHIQDGGCTFTIGQMLSFFRAMRECVMQVDFETLLEELLLPDDVDGHEQPPEAAGTEENPLILD